jgi:hypothetical protein
MDKLSKISGPGPCHSIEHPKNESLKVLADVDRPNRPYGRLKMAISHTKSSIHTNEIFTNLKRVQFVCEIEIFKRL